MKRLSLLIILTSVASFNVLACDTVCEKCFENKFINNLASYIESGNDSSLLIIANEDNMAFLAIGEYERSQDKLYFSDYLKRHLDIRAKHVAIIENTHPIYVNYEFPDGRGGAFKIHIFYPFTQRYDDAIITYGENGKLISMSLYTEVNLNPYYDGNINKVVGGEFGFEGVEGQEYKFDKN